MDVQHANSELEDAETDPEYRGGLDHERLRALRKAMNLVRQVPNESELRKYRGLNFEKLKGNRSHQYSIRLNDQWRLILEFKKMDGANSNVCIVIGIEDYH